MVVKEGATANTVPVDSGAMAEVVMAASGASVSSADYSTSATGSKGSNLDDMFSHLELNEDELDDVVIGIEEAKEYKQAARWLAIGKVHTSRSFSAEALFEKMKAIWNLSREPGCREAARTCSSFRCIVLGTGR
jgi:hypothetical protein